MDNDLDFEQSFAIGKRALGYIKYNATPAIPQNYELWYSYALGHNQALIHDIQDILQEQTRVSPQDARRLFDLHISPTRLSEKAEAVGLQINEEIKEIVGILKTNSVSTDEYGKSLDSAGKELDTLTDTEGLKKLVKKLAAETQEMAKNSRELESQLETSHQQITELSSNLEAIRIESLTDKLTGISNRKKFDETLLEEMDEAAESGKDLCVILADIDHFKKFNDTYGHQTGDQVLRLVAHTVNSNVKGRDLAARYGGEEFAIILPDTSMKNAISLADQIRNAVKKKELIKKSTNKSLGHVTLSLGVALYRPGETVQPLVHRADACLYAAKGAGRDQVKSELDPDINLSINAA